MLASSNTATARLLAHFDVEISLTTTQVAAAARALYLSGESVPVRSSADKTTLILGLNHGVAEITQSDNTVLSIWTPEAVFDEVVPQLLEAEDPWMEQAMANTRHLRSVRPYSGRPRSWASLPGISKPRPSLLGWAGAKHGGWLLQHRNQEHHLGESINMAAALLLNEL